MSIAGGGPFPGVVGEREGLTRSLSDGRQQINRREAGTVVRHKRFNSVSHFTFMRTVPSQAYIHYADLWQQRWMVPGPDPPRFWAFSAPAFSSESPGPGALYRTPVLKYSGFTLEEASTPKETPVPGELPAAWADPGDRAPSQWFCLAPEHLYPVPIKDCLSAAVHFLKHAEDYGVDLNRIIIGGDSTGSTYSTVLAQELVTRVDLPRFQAQILLYPFLQALDFNLPSYQQYHSTPTLPKKLAGQLSLRTLGKKVRDMDALMKNAHVPEVMRVKYSKWISADLIPVEFKVKASEPPLLAPFSEELYEVCKSAFETRFSPLLADDEIIQQLPETFLLTYEYDFLRDDGLLYKKCLEDNGVPVTWYHIKDGVHGIFHQFE
ncbi:arylacetamide deacetylase-like 3 [Tiliqua scincoides]|uniref:arylacetamide deacetylase-like 3 n=1 Tax=Tiliqua scincoides TaxID=71010 RepID=UPI003462C2D3